MSALVQIDGLSATRAGRPVLHELSLRIEPGQRLALSGPNGAGKSTLLRVVMGLERPVSGTITIDGHPCRTEADFRLARRRIGLLFQDPDDQLFCPTVVEDVAFGPQNLGLAQPFDLARDWLDRLGLGHLADRPVHHLSGGEKRLVCLAGLLAMSPGLLLLDEPTAALDPVAEARMLAALGDFAGAMLIVTHDQGLGPRLGAEVLRLDQGQIRR